MICTYLTLWLFLQSALFSVSALQNKTYHNPILPGFHPDPSCAFVPEWNDTFFCTTSSFNAFPGVPVFASKDLQNFRQIGNVITRPTQLPALGVTNKSTSGIWAPSIRYHDGLFYVVTTLANDQLAINATDRWNNILFTAESPYGEWSDPVHFPFAGYDTSPFWDTDGTTWIVGSHYWEVYPMIQAFQMNFNTGEVGEIYDLWAGIGTEAPEGPHIYSKDGYYYLMIAEGGTGLGHEENIARSSAIAGPYTGDSLNPILTNANTTQYFQTVGHADIFQDRAGNWWTVCLSTRSGPDFVYFPMGRETVLTPASWETGQFPTVHPVRGVEAGPLPPVDKDIPGDGKWIGTSDHLTFASGTTLPNNFVYLRFPDPSSFTVSAAGHPNTLGITTSVLNLTALDAATAATPQSFVGRRQEHVEFDYTVSLEWEPTFDGSEAGTTVFLTQGQHFDLGIVALTPQSAAQAGYSDAASSGKNSTLARYIRLRAITPSSNFGAVDPNSGPTIQFLDDGQGVLKADLRVQAVNHTTYLFSYRELGSDAWTSVGWGNSSGVSGGFVGTILGMFATGNGANGTDHAYFSDFEYVGNPDVY